MRGTKPHLVVDNGAIDRALPAPGWMSKDAKTEWRRVMPSLSARRVLTTADLGSLEHYCIAVGRVRQIERLLGDSDSFDAALFRAQDKAMSTARQLAAEIGLTPMSRSRPTVRKEGDDGPSPLDI